MSGESVRVEVVGLERLTRSLETFGDSLPDIAPRDAARIIGTAAKSRAPKRTGRLASSFSSDADKGRVTVAFSAPHAGPLNFGVGPRRGMRGPHNITATRFLSDAIPQTQDAWLETYREQIEDELSKVKGA